MKNKTTVSLVVYGHPNVDKLTDELGIKPDEALKTGEPYLERAGPIPQSIWEIEAKLSEEKDIEEHIAQLLNIVEPSKDRIADIAKEYRTVIVVGSHFSESNLGIELSPAIISSIAGLNAHLWLDLYAK